VSRYIGLAAPTLPIPAASLPSDVLHARTPWFRTARAIAGDVLLAIGVVLCVPFVILAIVMPIGLAVRLLSWLAGAM
jgi:hypothetical protein